MDVDHAALAIGGDDHETVVLAEFVIHQRELTDAAAERGLPVASANEVGVFTQPGPIAAIDERLNYPGSLKDLGLSGISKSENGSLIRYLFNSYAHILTVAARFSDSMVPQPGIVKGWALSAISCSRGTPRASLPNR